MYRIQCVICDIVFECELKGKEKRHMHNHLKKIHNITAYEYLIKYFYNNNHPLCACGCGTQVAYYKWSFMKYFEDHKNKMPTEEQTKDKRKKTLEKNAHERYKRFDLTYDDLEHYWKLYKTPDYPMRKISELSGVDYRIITKYWKLLKIANIFELKRYSMLHKSTWSNIGEKNGSFVSIDADTLTAMIEYAEKRYHIHKPISLLETMKKFKLDISQYILSKRLIEQFGDDCLKVFKNGLASNPEINYYFILKHFFGKNNVKHMFKLEEKFYDFLLFEQVIVEYDGDYWHGHKENHVRNKKEIFENDALKDEIAKQNGYKIYRVLQSNDKDINNILEIQKLIEETKNEV